MLLKLHFWSLMLGAFGLKIRKCMLIVFQMRRNDLFIWNMNIRANNSLLISVMACDNAG